MSSSSKIFQKNKISPHNTIKCIINRLRTVALVGWSVNFFFLHTLYITLLAENILAWCYDSCEFVYQLFKFIFQAHPDCLSGVRSRLRGWNSSWSGPGRLLSPGSVCQGGPGCQTNAAGIILMNIRSSREPVCTHVSGCDAELEPETCSSTNQQQTDLR